jgi:hypothetical protein
MDEKDSRPGSPFPASNFFAVNMNMKRRAVFEKLSFQRSEVIGSWFKKTVEYNVFRYIGCKMPQRRQENLGAFLLDLNITNVRA